MKKSLIALLASFLLAATVIAQGPPPGSGVWLATGENMENYGVPPDALVDNTPTDFMQGRDAQIEKAVEVLKAGLAKRTTTSQQQQR